MNGSHPYPPAGMADVPRAVIEAGLKAWRETWTGPVREPGAEDIARMRETITAVLYAYAGAPAGLDVRPVCVFTLHCSYCGKPAALSDYEDTPSWWPPDTLTNLGAYDLPGELNVDGHAYVCPECFGTEWCDTCDREIHAWQEHYKLPRKTKVTIGGFEYTGELCWHIACGPPRPEAMR